MVKSSRRGRKPGNKTNLKEAQRRGAVGNLLRSQRKIRELADYIERNPSITAASWSGRVETLNSAGHFNLVSEVHGETRPWTTNSLRKPFAAALAEIEVRKEIDCEDVDAALPASDGDLAQLP
jgi:hypothetical protein